VADEESDIQREKPIKIGLARKGYTGKVRRGSNPAIAGAEFNQVYRDDESRRALKRARTVENKAPADPTSASTTVGFSGESVQPVWARNGAAINRKSADQKRNCTDLFIIVLDLANQSTGTKMN